MFTNNIQYITDEKGRKKAVIVPIEVWEKIQKTLKPKKKGEFKFDWEGSLKEVKDKFTSVELQHKALEWR